MHADGVAAVHPIMLKQTVPQSYIIKKPSYLRDKYKDVFTPSRPCTVPTA